VAGSERGISAENGAYLENSLKPGGHCHLFVELRALRQVCLAFKVIQREQLRAALTGASGKFGGMHFEKTVLQPVFAHGHLDRGLHLEQIEIECAAQIHVAPVQAVIQGRQGFSKWIKRQRAICKVFHFEGFKLNLKLVEFYHGVVDHLAGNGQGAFCTQAGDPGCQVLVVWFPMRHLHQPGGIAQDQELDLLLIAQGLQPALNFHRLVQLATQVFDQCAFHASSLNYEYDCRLIISYSRRSPGY